MVFSEDSRVKLPCILHLIRLGYQYLSTKGREWDRDTNIFPDLFHSSISKINPNLEEDDITHFFQGSTDFGWLFPTIRQYTTSPSRMVQEGDILLSVRAPVGDMNIANIDCCICRGLAALNSKQGFDGFLFYVMKYFKQILDRRNSEGTTFGSITKQDLHSLTRCH